MVGAQLGTISMDLAEFSCHERSIPLKVCTLFRLSELFLLGSVGHSWLVGDMVLECSQLTTGTLLSQLALPAVALCEKALSPHFITHGTRAWLVQRQRLALQGHSKSAK